MFFKICHCFLIIEFRTAWGEEGTPSPPQGRSAPETTSEYVCAKPINNSFPFAAFSFLQIPGPFVSQSDLTPEDVGRLCGRYFNLVHEKDAADSIPGRTICSG